MPRSKKENIEEITLDPIEEMVKEPAPIEEPVEEPVEPETVEEGEDIAEPDAPIEPEFEEPEEGEQGENVEFDEEEEAGEDAPEESAPPVLGLMLGAKNAPVSEDPDPQSRIEALLWHIINGTTTDAVPQSRNEAILTAIANSGTYTEEAQSRIEALLISILNHEEVDITPISRNEAILKAIANSGEYGEEPQSRNEELLLKWLETWGIVIGTASGAVASFNTSLTENLLHAIAEFSATQASGTPTPDAPIPIVGVDKVNVTRCGKNLIDWKISSTAKQVYLPSGTYTLSWNGTLASGLWYIRGYDKSGNLYTDKSYLGLGASWTHSSSSHWNYATMNNPFSFTVPVGCSAIELLRQNENGTISAQLELGSTATAYEAYNGTTALINLGGTFYGGSVDAVTGKITLTHILRTFDGSENWAANKSTYTDTQYFILKVGDYGYVDTSKPQLSNIYSFDLDLSNNTRVCFAVVNSSARNRAQLSVRPENVASMTSVSDFTSILSQTNMTVAFALSEPIVVYASNTAEIPTINGLNQVFADSGDVAVEYKKRRND